MASPRAGEDAATDDSTRDDSSTTRTPASQSQSDAEKKWEPIREHGNGAAAPKPESRRDSLQSISRVPISRVLSQNGYGCDTEDEEATAASQADDPFVVGWDGGDADPMNPRSRSLGRKWLIVIINSSAALCV